LLDAPLIERALRHRSSEEPVWLAEHLFEQGRCGRPGSMTSFKTRAHQRLA
jgi:hypothetical protein